MNSFRIFRVMLRNKGDIFRNLTYASTIRTSRTYLSVLKIWRLQKWLVPGRSIAHSKSDAIFGNEDTFDVENEALEPSDTIRDLLFKDSTDQIMQQLKNCASVNEVFVTVTNFEMFMKPEHLMQAILVLSDLRDIYACYNNYNRPSMDHFLSNLSSNCEFKKLLYNIDIKLDQFTTEHLSFLLMFLHKLGISVEDILMQRIAYEIRDSLRKDFRLEYCSRLFRIIFMEHSIRPYYIVEDIIPTIINLLDTSMDNDQFRHLTICLNKLNRIISLDVMRKYRKCVEHLLGDKLTASDYKVLLQIVLFLNYPKWRNQNSLLISTILLQMKGVINQMSIQELLLIYQVFFKNQEPAELLNTIQRSSAKFLQQIDDKESVSVESHLKLFSAFMYFSPPIHRAQLRKDIKKYIKLCSDVNTFLLTRKIMSYIKITDMRVSQEFWNLSLGLLDQIHSIKDIIAMCFSYKAFNTDLTNFQSYNFERKLLSLIKDALKSEELIFVSTWSVFLSFALLYSNDETLIATLVEKCEGNSYHLKPTDCYHISESLSRIHTNSIGFKYVSRLKKLLHEVTKELITIDDSNFVNNNILIKACVMRNDYDDFILESLLYKYKDLEDVSSKMMDNVYGIFLETKTIIPEVINKFTEYMITHPDFIIGFNASRMLHLCYDLGYYPINDDEFFGTVTNILIRDQERLSGLAFLQGALALCFFNKLPSSFVKQIFTVEFMDKLDNELANCYSKDTYPQKVRRCLMQLNRAVCLEYPEFDVPWFHSKYVQEYLRKRAEDPVHTFKTRVKEYLTEVVGENNIEQDIITPYGYHVDFVVCLDKEGGIVAPGSELCYKRLALLLVGSHAYTYFYIHLKGKYQLKNRHLEILGYQVSVIKFSEWINLLYAGERLEYIRSLIWPDYSKVIINNR